MPSLSDSWFVYLVPFRWVRLGERVPLEVICSLRVCLVCKKKSQLCMGSGPHHVWKGLVGESWVGSTEGPRVGSLGLQWRPGNKRTEQDKWGCIFLWSSLSACLLASLWRCEYKPAVTALLTWPRLPWIARGECGREGHSWGQRVMPSSLPLPLPLPCLGRGERRASRLAVLAFLF